MGVFDGWEDWQEGDFMAEQSMSIDLTTAEGFKALETRAGSEVYDLYGFGHGDEAWNRLAGQSLADVAARLANDLLQESVSLPRNAFADPQAAGREMAVMRNVTAYVYRQQLERMVTERIRMGHPLPTGKPTPSPAPSQQHRQRLQNHSK